MKAVCVLPGDGIGPEVVACATRVLENATDELELVHADIGLGAYRSRGSFLPEDTLDLMKDCDSSLFGAVTSLPGERYESPVLRFRKQLGLYANLRPVRDLACRTRGGMDIVIVRENTEGLYTGDEREDDEGVTTLRRVTRLGARRIVEFALSFAEIEGRKHICCVHKANVLKRSDGLFLSVYNEVMERSGGEIERGDQLVDSAASRLVTAPESFDVIVTLNLYGDILSDVAAGVVGGLGFAPSGNIGDGHSVFEPAHGSAPDIAGKGTANPTATVLAAAMMLRHLGLEEAGDRVDRAVASAYRDGHRTLDIGGSCGSREFTDAVVDRL